ncbi:MAG: hypothetical protein JSV25_00275 [Spirochaetota bacterium]|nr:MAG: hypothetical protein JSV25_00275 [Spirochaetota bacterium]
MVVPLISATRLGGFLIIGNIPEKERIEQKNLLLLSYISGPFISDFILKEELVSKERELLQQREEVKGLLVLYDYFGTERRKISGALDRLSTLFNIETAVLVTGWDSKGGLEVASGIGITEEEIRRFRFSKSDRELTTILKKGEPKIPKDIAKRISLLSSELEREFKTYIAIPVCFHGINLGIFIILDMKGLGKRLPKPIKEKIKSISGFLVPYLLYNNLLNTDPYLSLEFSLEQEIEETKGSEYPLQIVVGTLKGTEKVMKDEEFKDYRSLYDKLYRVCKEIIARSGRVSMLNWKRIVLMIRDVQPEKVDGIINHIKERFTQILKRKKKKLTLTFKKVSYQPDKMSFYELISMVY